MNLSQKSFSEKIVQSLWIAGLVGPLPLVMSLHIANLHQIQSMPAYVFRILIWCVAVLALGVLVLRQWDKVWRIPDTLLSRLLLVAGVACYFSSALALSVALATVGWTLLSGSWMATHGDSKDNTNLRLLRYWTALCVLLPLPDFLVSRVGLAYEQLLASVAGSIFDVLRIPFRSASRTFEFTETTLSIDDVLVNSPSIVWMMFMSGVIVAWLRRPLALLPAYWVIVIFWTFGMHLVQLAVIAFAHQRFELDLSTGLLSIILTATNLVVVAGLFLSSDRLLCVLFMPIPLEDSPRTLSNPIVGTWNRFLLPLALDPSTRN